MPHPRPRAAPSGRNRGARAEELARQGGGANPGIRHTENAA
jgi:hypothetical protein